jgi:hypothetical protein
MLRKISTLVAGAAIIGTFTTATTHAADMTCAGTYRNGLTCITAHGIKTFTKANSPLKRNNINHVAACGDRVAVAAGKLVAMFDGKSWAKPIKARQPVYRVSCAAKGLWVKTGGDAGYWNGSSWQTWKRQDVFGGRGDVRDIAAGPNGTAWVISSRGAVSHYDGQGWKVYKDGQGFKGRVRFSAVTVDGKGRPWVVGGFALYAFTDGNWKMVVRPGATKFVEAGPKGRIWMGGGGARTVIHTPGGDSKTFKLPRLNDGAVDAKGRLWVATNFGIALWSDGKLDSRQAHNSKLANDKLTSVAVVGNGGELPAKIERRTGSIAGRLEWWDGGPVAGARIQLCGAPVPLRLIDKNKGPCSGLPLAFASRTGKDGRFRVDKTPPANYRIAVQAPESGKWAVISLGRKARLGEGQKHDLGKVRVSNSLKRK